jgi:hypothetical protein
VKRKKRAVMSRFIWVVRNRVARPVLVKGTNRVNNGQFLAPRHFEWMEGPVFGLIKNRAAIVKVRAALDWHVLWWSRCWQGEGLPLQEGTLAPCPSIVWARSHVAPHQFFNLVSFYPKILQESVCLVAQSRQQLLYPPSSSP